MPTGPDRDPFGISRGWWFEVGYRGVGGLVGSESDEVHGANTASGRRTATPTGFSRLEWMRDRAWQAEAGEEALVAEPRHRGDLVL
jgi:hypothetical protein